MAAVGVFVALGPRRSIVVAVALLLLVVGSQCPAARADIGTFGFTGAEQTFIVPAAVTNVHVVAVGAPGGSAKLAPGGGGAVMAADLTVTPGERLYVEVGGPGAGYADCCSTGGFNGGGFGASLTTGYVAGSSVNGGGGGGASDVRTIPRSGAGSLNSRLLVAAGGGGGGGGDDESGPLSDTTSKGGDAGAAAGPCAQCGGAGGAGTDTAGGAGGIGHNAPAGTSGLGAAGQFGVGGQGGEGSLNGGAAGGGGGGYYGGGGGSGTVIGNGGGGGGGSSFSVNGGTPTIDTSGTPSVSISYTLVPKADVGAASLAFGAVLVGDSSPDETVTVMNSGSAPLQVSSATVTGADVADFALGFGCSGPVAPGNSCRLPVRFTPHTAGDSSATLTIATNASGPAPTVTLTGVGTRPPAGGPTPVLRTTGPAHLTATKSTIRLLTGQRVTCPAGPGTCQVTVVLLAKRTHKVLGRLSRTVTPGKALVLIVTLNRAGRALLSHDSSIKATLTISAVKDGRVAKSTHTVTLRRQRSH